MSIYNISAGAERIAYPIADACRVVGIGRTNLYRLINEGKLEARKVGGRTLIPAESLRRLIDDAPSA